MQRDYFLEFPNQQYYVLPKVNIILKDEIKNIYLVIISRKLE